VIKTYTLALGAVAALGAATTLAALAEQSSGESRQEPRYACTITATKSTPEAGLAALARISPQGAAAAATASVRGIVAKTKLENESGCVVYSVHVRGNDGRVRDVMVDAGSGRVLFVEQPSAKAAKPEGAEGTGEAEKEAD
jgi:uncharacterized membrane protein YkoI